MATTANGIDSLLVLAKQPAEGAQAAANAGKVYPRVTATFDTEADKYSSNEIDQSQQQSDTRLGNFRVAGALNAEASCGTYAALLAALLRRDWTVAGATDATDTIAAVADGFERTGGSFITDGHRAGTVVIVDGFTGAAAGNNNKNFFLTAVTATKLTGQFMDGSNVAIEAEGDDVSITAPGKRTFTPLTGHTRDWFTAEVQDAAIGVNRVFTDQMVSKGDLSIQPNGMTTLNFTFVGKNELPTTAAAYFVNPAAAPGTGKFSGATAMLSVAGIPSLICTGMSLSIDGQGKLDSVIGTKYATAASRGRVMGSGQFTVLMQGSDYLDYFKDETEVSLAYVMAAGSGPLADFLAISAGRIKITSAKVDDGEKNKIITCAFDILRSNASDTQFDSTTVAIQDSTLV